MIELRFFLIIFLSFTLFSCSNSSKENLSAKRPAQSEQQPKPVPSITVPPIEMKSISVTEEKTIPAAVKTDLGIPNKIEKPHLPQDFSIGELGAGTVPSEVYLAVTDFCKRLTDSSFSATNVQFLPTAEIETITTLLRAIKPKEYRLGGGKNEGNDRYSFLIRLLGPEESASGVVYIQLMNTSWIIDDLSLEKDIKFDFNPLQYKHFL